MGDLMDTSAAARIANIGAGERRKRLVYGLAAFGGGVLIAVLLILIHFALPFALLLSREVKRSAAMSIRSIPWCCTTR